MGSLRKNDKQKSTVRPPVTENYGVYEKSRDAIAFPALLYCIRADILLQYPYPADYGKLPFSSLGGVDDPDDRQYRKYYPDKA